MDLEDISKIENRLINIAVTRIVDGQNDLTEFIRRQQFLQYIQSNKLQYNGICQCFYDYAFRLFVFYVGEAEYRLKKSLLTTVFKVVFKKLLGDSFFEMVNEERHKHYRTATAKINKYLHKMMVLLLDESIITQEEYRVLRGIFLKETHVWYSLMPISIGKDGNQESFIHVLKYMDKDVVNRHFKEKYNNAPLLRYPCKGDFYCIFMDAVRNNDNAMFMENFYDTPDKFL